jgi:hypothetical protein
MFIEIKFDTTDKWPLSSEIIHIWKEAPMPKLLSKLAVVVGVTLVVFVSHSLGSKQSETTANNQLKVTS